MTKHDNKHFATVWRKFQNSTPKAYTRISFEVCRLVHGPELPEKAFATLDTLKEWYRAILAGWLNDALAVADFWRGRLPDQEHELALYHVVLEARYTGIRRIQRRIFREKDGVPRELSISSYTELSSWCDFMFELLDDDEQHIESERHTLTFRYDKGVAYRLEEERKESTQMHDEWVNGIMHSMMKAICKGEPYRLEPDDDWILVEWSGLANKEKPITEVTVGLFVDSEPKPKLPDLQLLEDMISSTWKAMRRLGPVCHEEPRTTIPKQVRKHLDAVKLFCVRRESQSLGNDSETLRSSHPTSDDAKYNRILKIIYDTFVTMERHPRAYAKKQEHDLRDHLLTVLSTHYPNTTGETFSKRGRTDILVRHDGTNVFVGEFKFWRGLKSFHETIDQVLGYLTWRDSKAAIVCFVNNNEINPVLEQIKSGSSEHPCFIRLESKKAESWFQFEFKLNSDSSTNVHLAVLCFHFCE
jgi:hypothetical protein